VETWLAAASYGVFRGAQDKIHLKSYLRTGMSFRADHEIEHGKFLAVRDVESIWGWGTPAGRVRARRRATLIASGAGLKPGLRALEIGCGTGLFTHMFSQTGANIVAVDISGDLLEKAKARNLPADKVVFIEKRFEDCVVDGPFDAVIGSSILHHLEIAEAFPKIYDLLKPNGIMSFAEPNMLNPQVFAERKFRGLFPAVSPDEKAFVRWRLARDLHEAGFRDVEVIPFDWLHPATPHSMIRLVSGVGDALEKVPFLREFSGSVYIKAVRPADN
jgi:2-polyprenyl-3-methyl-5-hydroxy-6-metoxy-1,4-benzoquinol methylase